MFQSFTMEIGHKRFKISTHSTYYIEDSKVPHEGIVIKYFTGERNKVAKVINPDYLIYGEKHDVGDSH